METNKKAEKMKRQLVGTVVSAKMDKTAVVLIERPVTHKVYKKKYKVSKRFKIHDPKNEAQEGAKVIFQECRPFSKEKRWRLIKVII